MKILIIDDSKIDAFLAQNLMLKYNNEFDVEIECNPIKGKNKILQKNSINLIILDLNMPKFDGIKILKFMNKNNINIPVIVYSNFIDQYRDELDKEKIIRILHKNEMKNIDDEYITNIFMQLNSTKSCMILDSELKTYLERKKEHASSFYNALNELKKELTILK